MVGEGDARRFRRRVREERVVNGGEPEKPLRLQREEVLAEDVNRRRKGDPDLLQIDADDDSLRTDLAGNVLEPRTGGAAEIDDAVPLPDQAVLPVDLLQLVEGAGGVAVLFRLPKKKSSYSKRLMAALRAECPPPPAVCRR